MARIRSGNKPGPVPVRKPATKKKEPSGNNSAAQPGPHPMQGVIEFPKQPASAEDVVSERIIFEVGNTRFAIKWTAEIEPLPPAGPAPSPTCLHHGHLKTGERMCRSDRIY